MRNGSGIEENRRKGNGYETLLELWILRHAKSNWDADYPSDHERPLSTRGERAARELGEFLGSRGHEPGRILCSTAVRARRTVEILAETASWDRDVHFTRNLYEATASEVLTEIRSLDTDEGPLLVAGHQPTSADLASRLVGGGSLRFPTAALVAIACDTDRWSDLRFGTGSICWMTIPKLLARRD